MPLPLFLGLAAAAAGVGAIKIQAEKAKTTGATLKEAEASCSREASAYTPARTPTDAQKNMFMLLFKHAFSEDDKKDSPPTESDWGHLSKKTQIKATRKYSLFSWGQYSFYTQEAVYYHYKKKATHEMLYFDRINSYNPTTGIVDYGLTHEKRNISHWERFERLFVEQVARIWADENCTNPSILEFCFNNCHEFCMDLSFFKKSPITNAFRKQCKGHHGTLQKYFDHIRIKSIADGKITLQFWYYFHKVENEEYSENDTEYDAREKELEQERRVQEAALLQEKVYRAHAQLLSMTDDIAEVFQQALFHLYGVLFEKENIVLIKEPDFTFEGPSMLDRLNNLENTAQSVNAYLQDYADKNYK